MLAGGFLLEDSSERGVACIQLTTLAVWGGSFLVLRRVPGLYPAMSSFAINSVRIWPFNGGVILVDFHRVNVVGIETAMNSSNSHSSSPGPSLVSALASAQALKIGYSRMEKPIS